jgi:DNA-binding HxlR family transcriptional regulator
MELRRETGSPPQTTMRNHLRLLQELGIVARMRRSNFPSSVDYELEPAGRDLVAVAEVLKAWLAKAPQGGLEVGGEAARRAIKALTAGWSATIVRALAARPLCLTELNQLISGLNYPSLERRLTAMRLGGLIARSTADGRSTPYVATNWLRLAIGPLASGALWEIKHPARDAMPVSRLDVEAGFLLTIPPLVLAPAHSGRARLAVELPHNSRRGLAGVSVEVDNGRVRSCVASLNGEVTTWVSGPPAAWIRATLLGRLPGLEIGGDSTLGLALVDGLGESSLRPAMALPT